MRIHFGISRQTTRNRVHHDLNEEEELITSYVENSRIEKSQFKSTSFVLIKWILSLFLVVFSSFQIYYLSTNLVPTYFGEQETRSNPGVYFIGDVLTASLIVTIILSFLGLYVWGARRTLLLVTRHGHHLLDCIHFVYWLHPFDYSYHTGPPSGIFQFIYYSCYYAKWCHYLRETYRHSLSIVMTFHIANFNAMCMYL